jgi:hypothetical protein
MGSVSTDSINSGVKTLGKNCIYIKHLFFSCHYSLNNTI